MSGLFSTSVKVSEKSKEECLQILGNSIALEDLNVLAASAQKNGPEKFSGKIKKLLSNPFVKSAL